jgi:hypothetical protein
MKKSLSILLLAIIFSCSDHIGKDKVSETKTEQVESNNSQDPISGSGLAKDSLTGVQTTQVDQTSVDSKPADGKYRFEMAFSEKQGASMGEMVTVIVNGDAIKIIYEGDGNLKASKGTVLDEGTLMKHKSGVWIVGHDEKDNQTDVFGGCSGGPTVIDFKNKKYWTC